MDHLCLFCDECDKFYHPKCKGIFGKNLKPLASLSEWFCSSECKDLYEINETSETIVNATIVDSSDRGTIKELLLFKEIVSKEIEDVKKSQQFLSDMVDELRKENALIVQENVLLKQQLERACQQNTKHSKTTRDIESEINKIKQDKLINNIVITNMPKSSDCVSDFWKLATQMDVKIEKSDVSSIQLMHTSKVKGKSKDKPFSTSNAVLVKFNSHSAKIELIKKKSTAGAVLTEQMYTGGNLQQRAQRIFFRDHLTNYSLELFSKCKSIQKQAKLKFCWTKDCQIFLRENEKSKILRINSLEDIIKVKKQFKVTQ